MVYQGPAAVTPGNTNQLAELLIISVSYCVRHRILWAPPSPSPSSPDFCHRLLSAVAGSIPAATEGWHMVEWSKETERAPRLQIQRWDILLSLTLQEVIWTWGLSYPGERVGSWSRWFSSPVESLPFLDTWTLKWEVEDRSLERLETRFSMHGLSFFFLPYSGSSYSSSKLSDFKYLLSFQQGSNEAVCTQLEVPWRQEFVSVLYCCIHSI